MSSSTVAVAAVQAAPVYMDLEQSLAMAVDLINESAKKEARLVVFPETWLPGYPGWLDTCRDVTLWNHAPMKRLYAHLLENSVTVPGPACDAIGAAARQNRLTVAIGVQERVSNGPGRGTLYNTLLIFGPDGQLLSRHRKLVPTFSERLIWGQGDASGLGVVSTPAGRVGGLICWEHWMPMARQALHNAVEDIHVALWPSVKEVHQIASRHYAFEGRCFVIAAGAIMRAGDLPPDLESTVGTDAADGLLLNGGSAVIGPDGFYVAGPVFDDEVIVLARINLDRIREESLTLDVTGHYYRPDLFDFRIRPTAANAEVVAKSADEEDVLE